MEYLLLPSDPYVDQPLFTIPEPKKITIKQLGIKMFVYVKFNKTIDLADAARYNRLITKMRCKSWKRQQL